MNAWAERPNHIPWPPILFVGSILASALMGRLAPLPIFTAEIWAELLGALLVATGAALIGWAFLAFRRWHTTVLPHRGSTALIITGPFALSRNPIYLGEAVILAGLALLNGSAWYALTIPVFMLSLVRLAISREEAHLSLVFGEAWSAYAARVRRWL